MRLLGSTDLKRLHREWRRRTEGRLALLLDGVGQPYNVGAIVRSAAAFRVEKLYLVGATAPPDGSATAKTALGTDRYLEWAHYERPADAIAAVAADGFRLVGVELADESRPLHQIDLTGAVCLAVGNEQHGLSSSVLGACSAVGFVPLLGRVGSLNVSQATSIACYEVRRQAWAGPHESA